MANASAWFALAGALGGVALTGVIGLMTAALNHKWGEQTRVQASHEEQVRTIRDQRREACHKYLITTNSYWLTAEQLYFKVRRGEERDRAEHMRAAITALQDAYVYLSISCGSEVRKLARSYNQTLYDVHRAAENAEESRWEALAPHTHEVRNALREAMRAELGVQLTTPSRMTGTRRSSKSSSAAASVSFGVLTSTFSSG